MSLARQFPGSTDTRLWGCAAAILWSLAYTWRLAGRQIALGSSEGGWVYPYVGEVTAQVWLTASAAIGLALVLLHVTSRLLDRRESLAVMAWLVGGFAIQLALLWGAPGPLEARVTSERANSFYTATLKYGPVEFMQRHEAIAPTLPRHARSNMPGKVIFFHFLELFADSPRGLALLVVGFSNLGAILIHLLVKELSGDTRAAIFAVALYMVTPGKLVFFPVLNTVSPVLVLLPLWIHARALRTGSRLEGGLLGVSLYALLFFEPLPLVMGLVFLALLGGALVRGALAPLGAIKLVLHSMAAFAAAHALMLAVFRYDVLANFLQLLERAREFNRSAGRPYGVWARQNLWDFSFGVGTASAVLVLVAAVRLFRPRRGQSWCDHLAEPQALVTLSVISVLLVLDLVGINRGEVVRLWIFLACVFQITSAMLCARLRGIAPIGAVVASAILQSAVGASTVGFVLP